MDKQAYFQKKIEEATSTKEGLFYSAVYLFSNKGYANVGIREICHTLNIKGGSFYNHYNSKEELFDKILDYFSEMMNKVIFTAKEIEEIVKKGDIKFFFIENMKKFSQITNDPLFYTILQIIKMESYTNERAFDLEKRSNLYHIRRGYTEEILKKMMNKGVIKEFDVELITAEYYYTLKGLLDDYLLCEVWNEDTDEIMKKIKNHIEFFINILKK